MGHGQSLAQTPGVTDLLCLDRGMAWNGPTKQAKLRRLKARVVEILLAIVSTRVC